MIEFYIKLDYIGRYEVFNKNFISNIPPCCHERAPFVRVF